MNDLQTLKCLNDRSRQALGHSLYYSEYYLKPCTRRAPIWLRRWERNTKRKNAMFMWTWSGSPVWRCSLCACGSRIGLFARSDLKPPCGHPLKASERLCKNKIGPKPLEIRCVKNNTSKALVEAHLRKAGGVARGRAIWRAEAHVGKAGGMARGRGTWRRVRLVKPELNSRLTI